MNKTLPMRPLTTKSPGRARAVASPRAILFQAAKKMAGNVRIPNQRGFCARYIPPCGLTVVLAFFGVKTPSGSFWLSLMFEYCASR